ncbi:similar to Saccharomyces cerevisiae YOR279C RFM1 DNA-binding protein required for vegetative repression of middle sporulation genes [Maudiozyma saulgeensis]|uniref:Similar to Saccharomyces cerevisiae YOR279C RFM1 DNA-binding protein required for vegetative repression of middle sporulation genes n=1 Tax=Maudiozyma saulgeensis TaxID=1789683 RepID=A0A1X7R4W9_9SACH|nr:similar to Saccharomyces cerevisiae YOR279C RFM1 DNA-binding protein required for vegetative repression of middle sporulation genes [Kazachstania saulgeensis]
MTTGKINDNLNTIRKLYEKTKELNQEIKNIVKDIKPMEFESYADYFLIHTFKRGISESGRVNLDGLRKREQSIYYKRIRKPNEQKIDENISLPPKRASSEETSTSITPAQTVPSSDKEDISDSKIDINDPERKPVNKVSAEISLNSIISAEDGQNDGAHNIRRSSRISQKDREDKLKREHEKIEEDAQRILSRKKHRGPGRPSRSSYNDNDDGNDTGESFDSVSDSSNDKETLDSDLIVIKDLYETLVPKIKDPQRRSDWVLPPRMKYTQEKQLHTRPEYKSVKINELVGTNRISTILSRFEGGLAGVRR